jgi:hypothetical protein
MVLCDAGQIKDVAAADYAERSAEFALEWSGRYQGILAYVPTTASTFRGRPMTFTIRTWGSSARARA